MHNYLKNKEVLQGCKIYQMLSAHARGRHLSFHTPGHKTGAWDITELSFSDNLSCPQGCIAEAERDIAEILGAKKSFILTDGSTAGVLSMLYAAKAVGLKKLLIVGDAHKSVYNGCRLLGITPLPYACEKPTRGDGFLQAQAFIREADGIFCTSPDYYGNVANLQELRALCDQMKKLLLIDGAHGGHLHFERSLYAGAYADLWVDGVHKSLPAFTQGAVISARTESLAEALRAAVDIFRTTSPSYPIMASVEYAVKYPRNERLEKSAKELIDAEARILKNDDWTKVCTLFGENAFQAEKELEEEGIYPEFCDGNAVVFYLSPATSDEDFEALKLRLKSLFEKYPYEPKKAVQRVPAPLVLKKNTKTEWVDYDEAVGRICAENCGLFPPCTPLIFAGERIEKEKIELLKKADNVFGVNEKKILVYEG